MKTNTIPTMNKEETCAMLCDLLCRDGVFEETENLSCVEIAKHDEQYSLTTQFYYDDCLFTISGEIPRALAYKHLFKDEEDEILQDLERQIVDLKRKVNDRHLELFSDVISPTEIPYLYAYRTDEE